MSVAFKGFKGEHEGAGRVVEVGGASLLVDTSSQAWVTETARPYHTYGIHWEQLGTPWHLINTHQWPHRFYCDLS